MSTNETNPHEHAPSTESGETTPDSRDLNEEAGAAMEQAMNTTPAADAPVTPEPEAPAPKAAPSTPTVDDALNAEIESAIGDMSVADMMDDDQPHALKAQPIQPGQPLPRQARSGTIVAFHGDHAMVEFGPKMQGMCPLSAFKDKPDVGTEHEFILDRFDEKEGLYQLSLRGSVQKAEWENLEVGQVVKALCTGSNKGGLEMEVANHRAFMPAGQVDLRHIDDLETFVSNTMDCEVIEFNRQKKRIVLSRRRVLVTRRREQQADLLKELEVGQTRDATITSLMPYGAFADLGGLDGLVHVSDISHDRIKNPADVLKVGDEVKVKVLKISGDTKKPQELKIGLGMKQLQADPFEEGLKEINEGDTVSGKVTKIMEFGAFVEVAPGVEGLVHISELAHERVKKVQHVVQQDEVVQVKVLSIDPKSKRISLSVKALKEAPAGAEPETRGEDPQMRKLKAMLSDKFGDGLLGGLGKIPGEDD